MKITINILIDTRENKPKVEVLTDAPEENTSIAVEEPDKEDYREIRTKFREDFGNLRNSHDFQTLDAYSKILPTFHLTWNGSFKIWKVFIKLEFVETYRQFENFYNTGWIKIGPTNLFDIINSYTCDISLFMSQVAWEDERCLNGYLLLECRGKSGLLKIVRRDRGSEQKNNRYFIG